jgi:penicillin-binding protein 1C
LALAALTIFAALGWLALGLFPDPFEREAIWDWNVLVADREGRLLKEILPPPMSRKEYLRLEEFSPYLVEAVLAAEDKRFRLHPGVDPAAIVRALIMNVRGRRIISGGSTITMQTARLTLGLTPGPRTFRRKLREMWLALLLERHHSKDDILAAYLNSAPTGDLNVGFQAAAEAYLGKSAKSLSPAEAALLAGLPAAPSTYNPYRRPDRALARRQSVLRRMLAQGRLTAATAERALAEPLVLQAPQKAWLAPHFVNHLKSRLGPRPPKRIAATLDLELQQAVEALAASTVRRFRGHGLSQTAVVVLSLPEREVLAWVGSADFFDVDDGQNDGATTLRQPGSALKPFIYGLALDEGLVTAATLVNDEAADYAIPGGVFSPRNYSGASHGPVPVRTALASSLNLPAVNLTAALSVERVLEQLRRLGLSSLEREADWYGLGLALGGGEVSLLSLTTAYAALADGGRLRPPKIFLRPAELADGPAEPGSFRTARGPAEAGGASYGEAFQGGQVLSPEAAYIISDILSDDLARTTGFGAQGPLATPYRSSVKTGTSKNFRDNWCLGYTDGFVVGVWAGNFEAKPMEQISGLTGAGHLWRAVADLMAERRPPRPPERPQDVETARICPVSGLPAGPQCPNFRLELFIKGSVPAAQCRHDELGRQGLAPLAQQPGRRVDVIGLPRTFGFLTPVNGEVMAWDPDLPPEHQKIRAVVQSVPELDEIVLYCDGREVARRQVSGLRRAEFLADYRPGRRSLTAVGLSQGREAARTTTVVEAR